MPTNKPLFINTDSGVKNLQPTEALFLKDVEISVNKNGNQETGTANPSGEGQNEYVLTPVNSNIAVPDYLLPEGFNKHIGSFESKQTNEVYCFTYNSEGNHCIHVINGDTGSIDKIQYPYLNFGDGQENYIADNRCILRVIRDAENNIVEKILLFTDYKGWQKYVLIVTAIATDSFNDVLYPYWVTKQPHFDRREFVELAVRPPMFMPEFIKLPNTPADKGTPNRVLDIGFEFCMDFNNTDVPLLIDVKAKLDIQKDNIEGHYYFNNRAGEKYHGNLNTVYVNFGQTNLYFQWFFNKQKEGNQIKITLNNDLLIMSEKSCGSDFRSKLVPILKHAIGDNFKN